MGVGEHIRSEVIPQGMSVTEAARRMGVSRIALSNLLNGRASLSTAMRTRLERTFGADPKRLRKAQEKGESERLGDLEKAVRVRAYAPELVSIKARQISDWARGNTTSRGELPVLVRQLVHSTGHGVRVADFPGYDNAERPGWDGWIEADESTAWIPSGKSGWEFGTGVDVSRKAESDYQSRMRSVGVGDRGECTFVFVTPHDWPDKRLWAERKQADGWRDVRVLDASDLEQWLEESLTGQAWMASRLDIPTEGVCTLKACWESWTSRTNSPMTPAMFEPLVSMHARTIGDWLAGTGSETLVVSAESVDEALAFLACVSFTDGGLRLRETAIVFDAPDALRRLAHATSKMTIVVHDPDLKRELASAGGQHRAIIVRPRNIVGTEPDVTLPMLSYEQFRSGLAAMGVEDTNRVQRLVRESGRSLTVLRRCLSKVDTRPAWSRDASLTEELVAMALVGVWDTTSCADRRVLEKLSGRPYAEVEATVSRALKADDRPMWASGNHRGVVSRIDLLFTVANAMTAGRVQLFFDVAADVLGEEDPALALPEDERWMASVHGKVRRHSEALRVAVGETLVLLATYSKDLLPHHPEIDLGSRVAAAVRDLLTPMSPDLALSQERDLPRYAEAAPEVYLAAVEEDLARPEPAVTRLLQPTGRTPFLRFPRTGLLSGLECLAWSRQYLARVVYVLAELSKATIHDKFVNTPFNSLLSVFRFWMPQTSAPLETRVEVLRQLCEREPEIGWQVCMEQLEASPRLVASGSYRPRWRDFATGHGEPVPEAEALEFRNRAVEIALGWQHDEKTLADLVANLPGIGERERLEVWRLIEAWTAGPDATDEGRQRLGERIRGVVLTRRGARMLPTPLRKRARAVYDKLVPENSIGRIAWLFRSGGVEETADDTEAEEGGVARLDRIDRLGRDAMGALWTEMGFAGIDRLLAANGSALEIGRHLAPHVGDPRMVRDVVAYVLERSCTRQRLDGLLTGFFGCLNDAVLEASLGQLVRELPTAVLARVFLRAPVRSGTWRIIDGLPAEVRDQYWRQVAAPVVLRLTSAEWEELVDKLLAVGRPVAAMHAADTQWDQVGTSCLRRILEAVGTHPSNDPGEQVDLRVMSDGMTSLSERADVTEDELAGLELQHVTTLEHSEYGIPNLEKRISEAPEMFVQLLGMAYRRDDGQNDGAEGDDSKQQGAALVACAILRRMKRVPGEEGQSVDAEKLQRWVVKVRSLAASCGRAGVGDVVIGELLARAAGDVDQSPWPPRAICQVMEAAASDRMGHGFVTGVRNARGATVRAVDEGGRRERDLAAVYAAHADAQMIESPFVSTVLRWLGESFESDAKWMDAKTEVDRRLAH